MDVSVAFSGAKDQGDETDGPFYLTNTAGWIAVVSWAESLPGRFHAIRKLAESGECDDTMRLVQEIQDVLEKAPANVAGILSQFLEMSGVGDPEETAIIMTDDGSGPDTD